MSKSAKIIWTYLEIPDGKVVQEASAHRKRIKVCKKKSLIHIVIAKVRKRWCYDR